MGGKELHERIEMEEEIQESAHEQNVKEQKDDRDDEVKRNLRLKESSELEIENKEGNEIATAVCSERHLHVNITYDVIDLLSDDEIGEDDHSGNDDGKNDNKNDNNDNNNGNDKVDDKNEFEQEREHDKDSLSHVNVISSGIEQG